MSTLTLEEAANLLNVSTEWAAKLVAAGTIVLTLDSVSAYRVVRDRERDEALTELVRIGEEAGLYDDLIPPKS